MTKAQELFQKLLTEEKTCVLATSSLQAKPEAATIQYTIDKENNLYFESFPTYRKYSNIKENPKASIVITQEHHTIQMDGKVEELSGKSAIEAKKLIIEKHGKGIGYLEAKDVLFFKFTPSWIRILVEASYPPVYEIIKKP